MDIAATPAVYSNIAAVMKAFEDAGPCSNSCHPGSFFRKLGHDPQQIMEISIRISAVP